LTILIGFMDDRPIGTPRREGLIAANPVQYTLASLGSYQAITYRFWAAQLGIPFDELAVRVEGDLDIRGFFGFDDTVRPGFTAVRVEVTVTGPGPAGLHADEMSYALT
jgi:uncharacterized OsmC-like protein